MEEKAFAVITKDSVRLMAESVGHNISDEVAALLSEDVSYRLREIVMKSAAFMKNAKRRRLCPDDFTQALHDSDVQPVYGHGTVTDCAPFRQTREGELHFVEDAEVNLINAVCNSYVPKSLGRASIKAHWVAVEGLSKVSSSHNANFSQLSSKNFKQEMPADLKSYYSQITQALVGSHTVLVKWALADLSTNSGVVPLLPYFINFVANGVKTVSHDVAKLTLLMRTVESLVRNKFLFLETQPYLSQLVQAVENCLLEPLATYVNQQSTDHWMLRQLSAEILAEIIRKWSSHTNHLHSTVLDHLSETLQDQTRPLCSHYGAVMGLVALGPTEVKEILMPKLSTLLQFVRASMRNVELASQHLRSDAFRVLGAIQLAAQKMMTAHIEDFHLLYGQNKHQSTASTDRSVLLCEQDMAELYQQLYDCLGDKLSMQLPITELDSVFVRHPPENSISLENCESKRSGDELLSQLMQEVQQQQREQEQLNRQQHQWLQYQKSGKDSAFFQQCISGDAGAVELIYPSISVANLRDDSGILGTSSGYQEQLAVSSTISDPTKGTLKLKIKRQAQGQSSPSQRLTLQIQKPWTETEHQQQSTVAEDRDSKIKRKWKELSRNIWEQEAGVPRNLLDTDGNYSHQLNQSAQLFSSGGESSGSESNLQRKGKLMLKLKVPSKDSPSE